MAATVGGESFCVLGYHTNKSVITTEKTIRAWYKQFTETGCPCKQKSSGRPLTAEDVVERVRSSFLHSPKKSMVTAAKELSISKTTVWRVLLKGLVFSFYKCL
jgi:transposase